MAIEIQLKGSSELSNNLHDTLLAALGLGARDTPDVPDDVEYQLISTLVVVTAFTNSTKPTAGRRRGTRREATLFFRVADKGRVVEAVNLIVGCVGAVLKVTNEDMKLFFGGDTLLLTRVGGDVELLVRSDNPRDEFWTHERVRALGCECRFRPAAR